MFGPNHIKAAQYLICVRSYVLTGLDSHVFGIY